MIAGRSFPSCARALLLCAVSMPELARAGECSLEDVYKRALEIELGSRDVKVGDRQLDPPTTTGASAALVDSPRQTGSIAAALQQGLVKRGGDGALTISLAPFAWLSAAKPPGYLDEQSAYDRYDAARRLTGSLTLGGKGDAVDADGNGTVDDPAEAKSLADSIAIELQYRFGSRDRRDYPIPEVLKSNAEEFFTALKTASAIRNMLNPEFRGGGMLDDASCERLAKQVVEHPEFQNLEKTYQKFSDAIKVEQDRIDRSWIVSVAATALQRKDYLGPDKYALALRGLKGLESAEYLKFNAELGRIAHAGDGRRNIDSVKLAAEYARPVLAGVDFGGGQPTFSAALTAEHYRNVSAPAPNSVATFGLKWVFPIAKGVSIPLSISWANHTALLSDKDDVFGHVGIDLDLDQLSKL